MDRIDFAIYRLGFAGPCLSLVIQAGGHEHACPRCAGIGTVRVTGQPGWVRSLCPMCGGTGLLTPRTAS